MQNRKRLIFCLALLFSLSVQLKAQEALKSRPSPTSIESIKYKDTYIKITYCQPHKKGREIFGTLVPYGKVWRTGANEATEITLTDDILINQDTLAKGTYSIFTIPRPDEWVIIFNSELGQWGAYNYVESSDVMRIKVRTKTTDRDVVWEPFTITFSQVNEKADLKMMWDRTMVSVPIRFLEN
ncbi:MAG: DUF2911 domain-containing protein [Bacteroidota bacterium]